MAQTVKNLPAMQAIEDPSLGQEDPLEEGTTTPVFFFFFFFFLISLLIFSLTQGLRIVN